MGEGESASQESGELATFHRERIANERRLRRFTCKTEVRHCDPRAGVTLAEEDIPMSRWGKGFGCAEGHAVCPGPEDARFDERLPNGVNRFAV